MLNFMNYTLEILKDLKSVLQIQYTHVKVASILLKDINEHDNNFKAFN